MTKEAVIVIDLQNDFALKNGALYVPNGEQVVGNIANYLFGLKPENIAAVLFTLDTHVKEVYEASEEAKLFPIHCEKYTGGHKVTLDYNVIDTDIPVYEMEKGVFNAWEEDNLIVKNIDEYIEFEREDFFKNLKNQGVTTLNVVGLAENFCVKWFIDGAIDRGFNVKVYDKMTAPIVTTDPYKLEEIFANEIKNGEVKVIYE